jgi:hypothetical protein
MKKLLLNFLIFFLASNTYAQIKDFKNYQDSINIAELYAVEGYKQKALNTYFNMLTKSDGNFSKDIYNALILANKLKKYDTLFTLLELVKKKNFDNEYLLGLSEFTNLHSHPKWKKFIHTNNQIIYIDTLLRQKIDSLNYLDQHFRIKAGSYQTYGDTIRKIDSLNMTYILSLISKNGLPSEKEIGAQDFRGNQGYDIVIHHHCQSISQSESQRAKNGTAPKKDLLIMTSILTEQAKQGRILPNKCAQYIEYQNIGFKAGVFDIVRYSYNNNYSNYFFPKYNEYEIEEINQSRISICLEPLADYYKKVVYKTTNNNPKLIFDIRLNTWSMATEEDFIKMKDNENLLKLE